MSVCPAGQFLTATMILSITGCRDSACRLGFLCLAANPAYLGSWMRHVNLTKDSMTIIRQNDACEKTCNALRAHVRIPSYRPCRRVSSNGNRHESGTGNCCKQYVSMPSSFTYDLYARCDHQKAWPVSCVCFSQELDGIHRSRLQGTGLTAVGIQKHLQHRARPQGSTYNASDSLQEADRSIMKVRYWAPNDAPFLEHHLCCSYVAHLGFFALFSFCVCIEDCNRELHFVPLPLLIYSLMNSTRRSRLKDP